MSGSGVCFRVGRSVETGALLLERGSTSEHSCGSLIVTAEMFGEANFGGGRVSSDPPRTNGGTGLFVAKFRHDGAHVFSTVASTKPFGSDHRCRDVATDFGGGLRGTTRKEASGAPLPYHFVATFNANGSHRWSRTFEEGPGFEAVGVLGATGDILAAGSAGGTYTPDGQPRTARGNSDVILMRLKR